MIVSLPIFVLALILVVEGMKKSVQWSSLIMCVGTLGVSISIIVSILVGYPIASSLM